MQHQASSSAMVRVTGKSYFLIPKDIPQLAREGQLCGVFREYHYNDVIMGAIASKITSLTIVYSTVYSDADQRKHQSSASLAFVRGIHRWPFGCGWWQMHPHIIISINDNDNNNNDNDNNNNDYWWQSQPKHFIFHKLVLLSKLCLYHKLKIVFVLSHKLSWMQFCNGKPQVVGQIVT